MSESKSGREALSDMEKEVYSIAKSILSNEIDILKGSFLLSRYRLKIEHLQDDLLFFTGIASQTEEFPTSEAERKQWAQDALARLDAEREEFLSGAEESIRERCSSILSKLAKD